MYFPWHEAQWRLLSADLNRLPHALLLTGEAGIGKRALAQTLAKALLCESGTADAAKPCGRCEGCHWFDAGNHPDFRLLAPAADEAGDDEEGGKAKKKPSQYITIDQIRELADFVNISSHRAGRRITLIAPAEAMNVAAANALLKTLEEPPADALFILVSHHWRRLLPTIVSRCRRYAMPVPAEAPALAWLEAQGLAHAADHLAHAGGAPLLALAEADHDLMVARKELIAELAAPRQLEPLATAERLDRQKLDPAEVIDWLARWVFDLAGLSLADKIRYYPDKRQSVAELASRLDPIRLMRYADSVREARALAHHPLNNRLVYEQLLFGYLQAIRPAR